MTGEIVLSGKANWIERSCIKPLFDEVNLPQNPVAASVLVPLNGGAALLWSIKELLP